jgi:hypothetical protein
LQVEYKDHSSGQIQLAFAEAPNEALPLNCRPNFGSAWLTKDKFKVVVAKLLVSVMMWYRLELNINVLLDLAGCYIYLCLNHFSFPLFLKVLDNW